LDDLNEQGWSVLDWLGEDLQEVTFLVKVDQDVKGLQNVDWLNDLALGGLETELQVLVVGRWNGQELNTTGTEVGDRLDNVVGAESNVLNTGTSVVLNVLLDLGLLLAHGWFVDWHLDDFVEVSHDNGTKGRVFGVDLLVIDGPETVEVEGTLIEVTGGDHSVV